MRKNRLVILTDHRGIRTNIILFEVSPGGWQCARVVFQNVTPSTGNIGPYVGIPIDLADVKIKDASVSLR